MKEAVAALSAVLLSGALVAAAQDASGPSIWSGVFTAAQAKRGDDAYQASCSGCHGSNLRATDPEAVDLTGPAFRAKWNGKTLGERFETIRDTMPLGNGNSSRRQDVYGHPGVHSSVQRVSARKSGARARDRKTDRVRTESLEAANPSSRVEERAMSSNPKGPNPVSRRSFLKTTVAKGGAGIAVAAAGLQPKDGRGCQHQMGSVGGCGGGRCRGFGARVRVRGQRYRCFRDRDRGEFRHRWPRHHERRQHPARRRAQSAEEIRHGGLGRHDFRGLDPARSPVVPLQRPRHRPQVRRRKRCHVRVPAGPRRPVHRSRGKWGRRFDERRPNLPDRGMAHPQPVGGTPSRPERVRTRSKARGKRAQSGRANPAEALDDEHHPRKPAVGAGARNHRPVHGQRHQRSARGKACSSAPAGTPAT